MDSIIFHNAIELDHQNERVSAMFDYYNPQSTFLPQRQNFQMPQQMMQQPMSLTRVTGMDGAKAFQMPPNSVAALFDGGEDVFYIKSTDGAGFPTIKAFAFSPIDAKASQGEYVTRREFEELKGMIVNGKQYIQRQAEPERRSGANGGYDNGYDSWPEPTDAIAEPLFKRPTDC